MRNSLFLFVLSILFFGAPKAEAQQVTGLRGWSVVLDPGHAETQNQGAFGYSEAEAVLATGLELRRLLQTYTDIDAVHMTRTTSSEVTLSARVDFANATGAPFFHSIHSNAADAPTANSLFVLWPQLRDLREGIPNGGRRMSEIMGPLLGRSMRVPLSNNGAWGECSFYGVSTCGTGLKGSRNFVQRNTVMASALSEASFHTNPTINQLKMSADWKRMEARTMFYTYLRYLNVERPAFRAVMGIVSDRDSGQPINGAVVRVGEQTFTTDTWETNPNFRRLSPSNRNLLRNGFYYIEDAPAGPLPVTVSAEGFETFTGTVTAIDSFFTFLDVRMVNTIAPVVTSSTPTNGQEQVRYPDPIVLTFSRGMDRESVRQALTLSPEAPLTLNWSDLDRRLVITHPGLAPFTEYTLRIETTASASGNYRLEQPYELRFTTGPPDITPPAVTSTFPSANATNVDLQPLISFVFDELVDHTSLDGRVNFIATATPGLLPIRTDVVDVDGRTVIHIVPESILRPNIQYRARIEAGVRDVAGNPTTSARNLSFRTGTQEFTQTSLDDFEGTFTDHWWGPLQSGSTTQASIVSDSTLYGIESEIVNPATQSTQSYRLQFGWQAESTGPFLIRGYLNSGPAYNRLFNKNNQLQAFVFGDGSGAEMRFAVREIGPNALKVSPWVPVSWYGWRLVSWDMANTPPGEWITEGPLHDGNLRFDSFQLRYATGSRAFGRIYFDDLRTSRQVTTSAETLDGLPTTLTVLAPHPNPTAANIAFRFALPASDVVSVRIYDALGREVAHPVLDVPYAAGEHAVQWNASGLSAGVYLVRVETPTAMSTTRFVVLAR